jgi:type II secretory pathway predicted ATPase ExeA
MDRVKGPKLSAAGGQRSTGTGILCVSLQWLASDRASDRRNGRSRAGQRERLMETCFGRPEFKNSEFRSLLHPPLSLVRQDLTYCKHFGFAEPPFSGTSDPQFFYSNAANEKILTALAREIAGKGAFVAVTGEAGTGKTTLLRRLIGDSADKIDYIFIGVNARLSFIGLLREILEETGVSSISTDRESLLKQLDGYLQERRAKDRGVALVFDDAQPISEEVLKELPVLCSSEGKGLMSIVLAGQPGLQGRLAQVKSLKERMTLTKRLTPLRRSDVAPYIAFRLNKVGYQGEELFEQRAIERIIDSSGGVPRLINAVCDSALLRAYRACEYKVTAKMIDQAAYELRLGGHLPRMAQRTAAERIQLRNLERAFLAPQAKAESRVSDSEKEEDESRPTQPIHELKKSGQHHYRFSNVKRLRLSIGALMILVMSAWSFMMFYPQQRNGTGSTVTQREKIKAEPVHTPPEKTRVENKAVTKEPFQRAPASIPSLAVAEKNEKWNDLAGAKEPVEGPRVGEVESPASEQIYRVSGSSFLRNKPTADAEIIETLQPGTRIAVTSTSGEYFRVRSLSEEKISGFVHREDAFFERIQ